MALFCLTGAGGEDQCTPGDCFYKTRQCKQVGGQGFIAMQMKGITSTLSQRVTHHYMVEDLNMHITMHLVPKK